MPVSAFELLSHLREVGATVTAQEGGQLRIGGAHLTDRKRGAIVALKFHLLDLLRLEPELAQHAEALFDAEQAGQTDTAAYRGTLAHFELLLARYETSGSVEAPYA